VRCYSRPDNLRLRNQITGNRSSENSKLCQYDLLKTISHKFNKIQKNAEFGADFEFVEKVTKSLVQKSYLRATKFLYVYRLRLQILHFLYPQWIFVKKKKLFRSY
jgi:hypothetical protein